MPAAPSSVRPLKQILSRPVLLLALAAYGASLATPAFVCERGTGFLGYEVLTTGWVGLLALDPRWLGNPLALWMICSAMFGWRNKFTVLGAVFTLVLAAGSVLPAIGCAGDPGSAAMSLGLGPGGYLWIAAISTVAICAMRQASRQEAAEPLPPPVLRPLDGPVYAALADFRAGHAPRTRCPECRALILVTPDAARSVSGSKHVTMACACGACDGRYEVLEQPPAS